MQRFLGDPERARLEALLEAHPRLGPFRGAAGVARAVATIEALLARHAAPRPAEATRADTAAARAELEALGAEAAALAARVAALPDAARVHLETADPGAAGGIERLRELAGWAEDLAREAAAAARRAKRPAPGPTPRHPAEDLIEALDALWRDVSAEPRRRDHAATSAFAGVIELCGQCFGLEAHDAHRLRVRVFDRIELSESATLLASIPDLD